MKYQECPPRGSRAFCVRGKPPWMALDIYERQLQILRLVENDGLTYAEIGRRLKISSGRVAQIYRSAKHKQACGKLPKNI